MRKRFAADGKAIVPELLSPAGSFEKLVTAVHYGADAVYLGGKDFSLRAKSGNFSREELKEAVRFAHGNGVQVYITVNIIAHNEDLLALPEYLEFLGGIAIDGVIVADPGVLDMVTRLLPGVAVHLSTQANVTNASSAAFWQRFGVRRINLARELSLSEIKAIADKVKVELEVFVHGALCISYSGRCMLSNYFSARDANRGNCAQPCRFQYAVVEEKRPGQFFPVEEDERGTYIFNAKDLCLLQALPQLMAAGVDAVKIEGRMKSLFYVGGVVRVYRAAIDYLAKLPAKLWQEPEKIGLPEEFMQEILRCGTRGYTENFIHQRPNQEAMNYESSRLVQEYEPVAVIRRVSQKTVWVEIRNTLSLGETVEYMGREIVGKQLKIIQMLDSNQEKQSRVHPGDREKLFAISTEPPLDKALVNGLIRRQKSLS